MECLSMYQIFNKHDSSVSKLDYKKPSESVTGSELVHCTFKWKWSLQAGFPTKLNMVYKTILPRNNTSAWLFFHLGNFAFGCYYDDIYYNNTFYGICITHTYVCIHTCINNFDSKLRRLTHLWNGLSNYMILTPSWSKTNLIIHCHKTFKGKCKGSAQYIVSLLLHWIPHPLWLPSQTLAAGSHTGGPGSSSGKLSSHRCHISCVCVWWHSAALSRSVWFCLHPAWSHCGVTSHSESETRRKKNPNDVSFFFHSSYKYNHHLEIFGIRELCDQNGVWLEKGLTGQLNGKCNWEPEKHKGPDGKWRGSRTQSKDGVQGYQTGVWVDDHLQNKGKNEKTQLTMIFRSTKVLVVQLKSSGGSQPFSMLQWRTAFPEGNKVNGKW